jgi:voltage-gated potassium channel
VAEAQSLGYLAVLGSASDEKTLAEAGLSRARVLATVLPDDSANVFITLTAREMNETIEIIARAEAPASEKKLRRSGANRVVLPALIGATKISNLITRPSADDLLLQAAGTAHLNEELKAIGLELTEVEVQEKSVIIGETISGVEVGGGFVIVAIKRADGTLLRNPETDTVLAERDILVIVGHQSAVPRLARRAKPKAQGSFRGVSSG